LVQNWNEDDTPQGSRTGTPSRGTRGRETAGNETVGELCDVLLEVDRIESSHWGDKTNAAIMRYLAATRLKTGRAARISDIADTLGLGVATVHSRLAKLREWTPPGCETPVQVVERTEDGYAETPEGIRRTAEIARQIEPVLRRLARHLR
jgi:hypothetical protein